MTATEADEIEASSDFENFNVEGTITVEWPDFTLELNMSKTGFKLLGKWTLLCVHCHYQTFYTYFSPLHKLGMNSTAAHW